MKRVLLVLRSSPRAILPIAVTIIVSFLPQILAWFKALAGDVNTDGAEYYFNTPASLSVLLPILASMCYNLYDLSLTDTKFRSTTDQYIFFISCGLVILCTYLIADPPVVSKISFNLWYISIAILIYTIVVMFVAKSREIINIDPAAVRNRATQDLKDAI